MENMKNMKQKTMSIIIFLTLVMTAFAIIPMNASAFSGTGAGTAIDPYQITTIEQLDEIRDDLTAHYILMNDLDFNDDASYADPGANKAGFTTGDGWNPIGNSFGTRFQGVFNGDNHTISNLFIDRSSTYDVGLFGYIGDSAIIYNLGIKDADVRGQEYVGILVGTSNDGEIYNCYSTGTVSGSSGKIGGLVGRNFKGLISKCYSSASVSGATIGGLVGRNEGQGSVQGRVENSYATGTVSAFAPNSGGLIGLNFGTTRVSNCFATGSVSGGTEGNRGGLIGHESFSGNIVENSFYDEDTTGQSDTGKGEPKSTAEMKDFDTFDTAGWEIETRKTDLNNGYPYLSWQLGNSPTWLIYEPGPVLNIDTGLSYDTIQEAIDATETLDGHTIQANDGIYNENVVVNKQLTLQAGSNPIIDGGGSGNGFLIQAANVVIDGFEIRNYQIGIRTYGGPANYQMLTIKNCNIHSNTQNGILIVHDIFNSVIIQNSQINSNTQNGIGIGNGAEISQLTINPSTISNNGHHGIYIANSGTTISAITITDTDLIGNSYSAVTIDSGSSVSDATFTNCDLINSDINFVVRDASTTVNNLYMIDTSLSGSPTNHGFQLRDGTINGLTFENVFMTSNRYQGFFVSNQATLIDATITGGSIGRNDWGILIRDSTITNLEVKGVNLWDSSAGSGLSVASGTVTGLLVEDCDFQNNDWEHLDIGIGWIGTVTVSDVLITGNTFGPGPGTCLWIDGTAVFQDGDIIVRCNSFVSGATGVNNNVPVTIDATNNWWGDASGPSGEGLGSGDSVSTNVNFNPWETSFPPCAPVVQPVGGIFVPVDKTAVVTPYIHMAVLFMAIIVLLASVVIYYKRK